MGQNSSAQFQDFIPAFLSQLLDDEHHSNSLISTEIQSLSYDEFLETLGELNLLSQKCLDSGGKQLVFAVKRGSDSTVFWRATVQIACVKINPQDQRVISYRLLNLSEFLRVFKTLKCHYSAAQQSKRCDEGDTSSVMSATTFFDHIDGVTKSSNGIDQTECCICLERQPEVSLPCAHSYCVPCIEEWNECHDTCPICRERLGSTDDTWVLSEVPRADEISEEIRSNLMNLAKNRSQKCSPS